MKNPFLDVLFVLGYFELFVPGYFKFFVLGYFKAMRRIVDRYYVKNSEK